MREIVFDTETTGFDPETGDRLIEIGCVELLNHLPTGNTCHLYINPERDVPEEAVAVHGLTGDFLKDKPLFSQVVDEFLNFVGDGVLVAHNAGFDKKFINWELKNLGFKPLPDKQFVDSLELARKKHPGAPASLDALCKRYKIDNSARTYHGALLDAELLAEVWLQLHGGRQQGLSLASDAAANSNAAGHGDIIVPKEVRPARQFTASSAEIAAHKTFLDGLGDPLWLDRG